MHFAHARNITVANTTIKNCSASHALILDALKDSTVSDVTFKDDVADPSLHPGDTRFANEAVHIDAATGNDAAPGAEPFDNTNSQNVTVTVARSTTS